ncbi:MAG: diphosphokinase / guanosine-3,5-bis(diphosphate) 3-diphosphatase [Actinomycetota bacterium]|nr:diphosphokinase / guanosine-3,5-bis(diphosphate) 3-diphosphatase [Actinomycetota bacterium]
MASDVTPVVSAAGAVQSSIQPAPADAASRPGGVADAPVPAEIDHLDAHAAPRTTGVPDEPTSRTPPPTEVAGPPSGRRVRARLARLTATKPGAMPAVLEPLAKTIRAAHPKADLRVVQKAYETAESAHADQKRRSGEPYITHPLAVATILAELGMDTTTLVAALLHDTVEDTPYTLTDVRRDFGEDVEHLVDGVTKLDKIKYGEAAEAETIRKMVVAMARDPRVLVIKLADRLHNMRTLGFMPQEKQERTATTTLEIFAPLAHRLGMNTIKWELEDLAFATIYPKRYDEIVRLVADRAPSRDTQLAQVVEKVQADLSAAKIKATVTGRPKHYYSIYQKMIVRGRDFADIYDLVGIRVTVDSVRDCYAALGTIHALWSPVPGRFKDYIAMPKFNMYQSLHTTVIGPEGKPVEMQIRTAEMHKRAEYGIAAHWKYKESPTSQGPVKGDDMSWLRQLLDWQKEAADPGEFLDSLRFDLHQTEVFVFTPKGDVMSLPAGSTPVDFAYAVHTEVGHRCIGARVNGRLVPLESTLDNGDVVEVFTSKTETAHPSQDWLQFVKSPRARNKIKQWFAKERREDAVELGKEAIGRAMRKQGLPLQRLLGGEALLTLSKEMRLADITALYAEVGEGRVSAQTIVQRVMQAMGGAEGAVEDLAETAVPTRPVRRPRPANDPGIVVKGVSDVWVKLARCCTPVPGDDVVGFVTRGRGVSVHRADCVNAGPLLAEQDRVVEVEWAPTAGSLFLVNIQVEALDRTRLLSDVTRVLSDAHVSILSATVTTTRDRVAVSRFSFEMADPKHLGHLLAQVRTVEGVYDAYRVTS